MKRVKLTVAYDGTAYRGWQVQPNGITIEEVLNNALSDLLKEPVSITGASRTDSGVHANGNIAIFDTENRMPADKICFAVNQRLPEDIRVLDSEEVDPDWHPRKQNCTKTYEYKILNCRIDVPTKRLYAHFTYYPLDVEKMRLGAQYLIGEHDFTSFCSAKHQAEETVRTLYQIDVEKGTDDIVTIRLKGNGFLYNMVRIIAGTLMKVGMGQCAPEEMETILEARDRQRAGQTAPAKGLTLMSIDYEKEPAAEIAGENRHYRYVLDQKELEKTGTSILNIDFCEEAELERLIRRMVHQGYRNGAERVYVRVPEHLSIEEGKPYGLYVLKQMSGGDYETEYCGK